MNMSIAFAVALTATIWTELPGYERVEHFRHETRIEAKIIGAVVKFDYDGRLALWEELGLCSGYLCVRQEDYGECQWRMSIGLPCIDLKNENERGWNPAPLYMLINRVPI